MKAFKDGKDRLWELVVNVGTAKRVKDLTYVPAKDNEAAVPGVDLFGLYSDEAQRLFSDPCLLVNVLYILCQKQAEERKITDEEFGASMFGDSLEQAANSLLEEVADFFPSSRRKILRRTLEKCGEITEAMEAKVMTALDQMNTETLVAEMSKPPQTSLNSATN